MNFLLQIDQTSSPNGCPDFFQLSKNTCAIEDCDLHEDEHIFTVWILFHLLYLLKFHSVSTGKYTIFFSLHSRKTRLYFQESTTSYCTFHITSKRKTLSTALRVWLLDLLNSTGWAQMPFKKPVWKTAVSHCATHLPLPKSCNDRQCQHQFKKTNPSSRGFLTKFPVHV